MTDTGAYVVGFIVAVAVVILMTVLVSRTQPAPPASLVPVSAGPDLILPCYSTIDDALAAGDQEDAACTQWWDPTDGWVVGPAHAFEPYVDTTVDFTDMP